MKKPTEKFRRTSQRPRRTPRIGALVHEFALASSVTLPSELAMAAAQASGQITVTGELPVTLFSPRGGRERERASQREREREKREREKERERERKFVDDLKQTNRTT